jgi:parallel beta-helix repeat protein
MSLAMRNVLRLTLAGMLLSTSWLLTAAGRAAQPASGASFYVSAQGRDDWSGKLAAPNAAATDGPFATLAKARDTARQIKAQATGPVVVYVRGGLYALQEPLVFTVQDSGTTPAPVIYAAYPGEVPVLSGGRPITGWKPASGKAGLWMAEVPEAKQGRWDFHQLFVNGQRRQRARTPNQGFFHVDGQISTDNPARFSFRPGDIRPEWAQSEAELVGLNKWQFYRMFLRAVDAPTQTATLSRTRLPSSEEQNSRYWIENTLDGLDAPGEWYLSRREGVVYYLPLPGEDLGKAQVIAPALQRLIRFEGSAGDYVHDITLRGLTLSYTDWSIPAAGSAWHQAGPELPSAVEASGARACAIENCVFSHLGAYALGFDKGSKDNRIVGNEMTDLGGGGVKLGDAACGVHPNRQAAARRAVASPKQQKTRWPLDPADYRTQPDYPHAEAEATRSNVVSDNRIHNIGHVFSGVVGIWVGQSSGNTVAHNEIFDTYYSGISCGWTWGFGPTAARHNIIEWNHIHHIGRGLMSDMGGIYTLGVQPGTILRNNLIHDVRRYDQPGGYGGWGIYLDSTSSQMRVENNVIYRTDDGAVHQNAGQQNTIVNNILAFGRAAQLQRSNGAPELSFKFERNIVYYQEGDLFRTRLGEGEFFFDYNLYYRTDGQPVGFGRAMSGHISLHEWQQRGQDQHSLVADPRFADPQRGDFSLLPDSPALRIGFRPIDLSQAGPRQTSALRQ